MRTFLLFSKLGLSVGFKFIIGITVFGLVLLLGNFSCKAQPTPHNQLEGKWYLELEHNDIGFVRTSMTFETDNQTFEAYTRKKADKAILGSWTSFLGRIFTNSFKGGSLLRIEKGVFATDKDSLKLAGILVSALGSYNIEGFIVDNELHAKIRNRSGIKGVLKGSPKQIKLPMEDYSALFEKTIQLTGSKIYNRALLQTDEWQSFVKDMREVSQKMHDDLEMVFAFFYYAQKLPVSHYALMKIRQEEMQRSDQLEKQRVFLQEKTPQTAYMKIIAFDGPAHEIESVFSVVKQKNYQNLIVDLRNNSGGSVEAGMSFASNVADTSFYGGVFLTQKYFNQHQSIPAVVDYDKFQHFTEANFDMIISGIHETDVLCLKVIPKENSYQGNIYILTNGRTASTCEPIVYGLKQQKRATIVGEKTAGAMLNGEIFDLDKGFKMIIPTADYYTSDGYRIDQNGVQPDIEVKQEAALEYVISNLIK